MTGKAKLSEGKEGVAKEEKARMVGSSNQQMDSGRREGR